MNTLTSTSRLYMTLTKEQIIKQIYEQWFRGSADLLELDCSEYAMLSEIYDYALGVGFCAGLDSAQSPAQQINDCDYLRSIYGKQND